MTYISENHGLYEKELDDFKFHTDLKRFPSILVHNYNPLLEGQWIPACATGGMCHSFNLIKQGFSAEWVDPKSFTYNHRFVFRPTNSDKVRWPGRDLEYEACTGCDRPIYLRDSIRLNSLIGYKEPKKVLSKVDFEGLDDFW